MENKAKRIYSLDIIRIIATACILFHHYQQNLGLSFDRGINFYFGWFYFGNLVELFFVMSGFFIYRDHNKIKKLVFGQWFSKKYLRFIPLVALSVIVYEILVVVYVKVFKDTYFGSSVNLWGAVITALGIQDGWVFRNPVINNPVWYISVLLLCYLIFYIIITVSNKYKISPVYGFIIMILVGCSVLEYRIDLPFLNFGAARGYYSFFSGGGISLLSRKAYIREKACSTKRLVCCLANNFDCIKKCLDRKWDRLYFNILLFSGADHFIYEPSFQ